MASRLKFHEIHADNVKLSKEGKVARRIESFCKGVAFSNRPIGIDEIVVMKLADTSSNWSGVFRFGVTNHNPVMFEGNVPKYTCPDMTNKEGTWAKAIAERHCQKGNVIHFYVQQNGELYYGINGTQKGQFLSGVNTRDPLWVVMDIYGNSTAVEFLEPSEFPIRFPPSRSTESMPGASGMAQSSSSTTRYQASIDANQAATARNALLNNQRMTAAVSAPLFGNQIPASQIHVEPQIKTRPGAMLVLPMTGPSFSDQRTPQVQNLLPSRSSNSQQAIKVTPPVPAQAQLSSQRQSSIPSDFRQPLRVALPPPMDLSVPPPVHRGASTGSFNANQANMTANSDLTSTQRAYGQNIQTGQQAFADVTQTIDQMGRLNIGAKQQAASVPSDDQQPSTSAAAAGGAGDDDNECVVCMLEKINCVLYTCGHLCMCYACAQVTWKKQGLCPVCRQPIKDVIKTFWAAA